VHTYLGPITFHSAWSTSHLVYRCSLSSLWDHI